METNINHLPHSHCMCGILNVVFRSTSDECGKPFDMKVIWLVHIHFFSASFFFSYRWLGWRGLPHLSGVPLCGISIDVLWVHFTLTTSFVVSQLSFVVFCKPHLDCHHSRHPHISESHLSKFHVHEQVKKLFHYIHKL